MTEEERGKAFESIHAILKEHSTTDAISILLGFVCGAIEVLSPNVRKKNRDIILTGITNALNGDTLPKKDKEMTDKKLLVLHIDGVNDEDVPNIIKDIKEKVRPLLNVVGDIFHEQEYTLAEIMSVVSSLIGRMYEPVCTNRKDMQEGVRHYIENSIKLTMDSCERGHKMVN